MSKTILVVDDNEHGRYLLRATLVAKGYDVVEAVEGAAALALAQTETPQLCISDILMPVMDGFALCRAWRADERLRSVPFVFCTATYTDERDRRFGLELGADRFIIKPVDPPTIARIVEEVLAEAAEGRVAAPPKAPDAERQLLKQYNEALIRKLEAKTAALEATNRRLEQELVTRHLGESALRRTRAHYQALIESSADHVFLLSPEGRFVTSNDRVQQFGLATGLELEGRTVAEVYPADTARLVREHLRATVNLGETEIFEYEHLVEDEVHCYQVTLFPLFDQSRVSGVGGISHDITALRQAETEARQRTSQLEQLVRLERELLPLRPIVELAEAVLPQLVELFPAGRLSLALFEEEQARLLAVSAPEPTALPTGSRLPLSAYDQLFETVEGGGSMLAGELDESVHAELIAEGWRSNLCFALRFEDQLLGALECFFSESAPERPAGADTGREVANAIAIALHNARLYERVCGRLHS